MISKMKTTEFDETLDRLEEAVKSADEAGMQQLMRKTYSCQAELKIIALGCAEKGFVNLLK